MKKPPLRPDLPPRRSDNDKRRLLPAPDDQLVQQLLATAHYLGSSKHKLHPHLFGLPPYRGARGDETLCDAHAGFAPEHMVFVPELIRRGISSGLVGRGQMLWTIADTGWIFEARLTNPSRAEYHGYPVRASEPIGECVYRRFAVWVQEYGSEADRQAAANCKSLYGFK